MDKAELVFDKVIRTDDSLMLLNKDDGLEKDNAIVILGCPTKKIGIEFAYETLEKLYPGYKLICHSLIHEADKVFDVIKISCSGNEHDVWFDISSFYGR